MTFSVNDLVVVTSEPPEKYKSHYKDWYATQLELYQTQQIVKVVAKANGSTDGYIWYSIDCNIKNHDTVMDIADVHLKRIYES